MLWILGCSLMREAPKAPECQDGTLFFTPSTAVKTFPREFDDGYHNDGPNVAILDIDGDGILEILQCFPREETHLHSWRGRSFFLDGCGFMLVEDLNGDGWDDLILEVEDEDLDVQNIEIWKNQEGEFEKMSSFSLGEDYARTIRSGDLNGDGLYDLFVSKNGFREEMSDRDVIAYATSTWEFELSQSSLPAEFSDRKAFDSIVMDIDQQGSPDIYVANDRGYEFGGNVFWTMEADGWTASESCDCVPIQDSMGVDVADYNHDGHLDIVTSDVNQNYLFEGLGNGEFVNMTHARGANWMKEHEMSWGIRFVDVDNDGTMEIFSAQGDHTYEGNDTPEYIGDLGLSIQTVREGLFEAVEENFGFTQQGSFRSVVPFHWNDDGVLDYWITDAEQASILMESNGCSYGNWLFVDGPTGTGIRFWVDEQPFYGEIHGTASYAASITPQIHFGLGDVAKISRVEIRYPTEDWVLLYDELSVPHHLSLP